MPRNTTSKPKTKKTSKRILESPGSDPRPRLLPTLGPQVCRWIEQNLVHGPGDVAGQRIKLRRWQRAIIYRCYELRDNGQRRWMRIVLFLPRGSAKTELLAILGLVELCGPSQFSHWDENGDPVGKMRTSPDVPLFAGSFEQADLAYGAAKAIVNLSPLSEFIECWDTEMLFRDGRPGKLYRVAAVAGTNEGGRPTFVGGDEGHEITGNKKRLHTVMQNAVRKRAKAGAWSLDITTAGAVGQDSVAEDAWKQYQIQLRDGEISPTTLVIYHGAEEHWNLDDPDQLRAAIKQAHPAADDWIDIDLVAASWRSPDMPTHEFRRYWLNQWVDLDAENNWLADVPGAWKKCFAPTLELEPGQQIAAGVDWALKHDRAAVVWGGLVEDPNEPGRRRRVVRSRTFTAPEAGKLDPGDAMQLLRELSLEYKLDAVSYDPRFFDMPAQILEDEGLPMLETPQTTDRMVPRCGFAFTAITGGDVAHDGDLELAKHVNSAVRRYGIDRGWTLSKSKSMNPIDACIALVLQLWEAEQLDIAPKFPAVQVW